MVKSATACPWSCDMFDSFETPSAVTKVMKKNSGILLVQTLFTCRKDYRLNFQAVTAILLKDVNSHQYEFVEHSVLLCM